MRKLVVTSRIDGDPLAWKCTDCQWSISKPPGHAPADEVKLRIKEQFKKHDCNNFKFAPR